MINFQSLYERKVVTTSGRRWMICYTFAQTREESIAGDVRLYALAVELDANDGVMTPAPVQLIQYEDEGLVSLNALRQIAKRQTAR